MQSVGPKSGLSGPYNLNYAESSRFRPVVNVRARNHNPDEAIMRGLSLFCVLLIASSVLASDVEKQLLGVWKLESLYTEFKGTGEKKNVYGERPNGYLVFTPEKRMVAILTAEQRKKPDTDEDRIAAFRSMFAYSGIYRVEGDKWTTKVDVAWNEAWTGTDQIRFFRLEGDKLTVVTMWQPNLNLPGNPETRGVLVWSRVKGPQ
jgi:Lipocalin-like domain